VAHISTAPYITNTQNGTNLTTRYIYTKGGQINFSVINLVMNLSKHFWFPDSCRTTERNGNSMNTDVTDDVIKND